MQKANGVVFGIVRTEAVGTYQFSQAICLVRWRHFPRSTHFRQLYAHAALGELPRSFTASKAATDNLDIKIFAHSARLSKIFGAAQAKAPRWAMGFTLNSSADGTILRPTLVPPPSDAHKYSRGHAMVWSGPALHTGASRLSAQAALAVGAGLVTIVGERAALAEHAAHVTAIMLREANRAFDFVDYRVSAFAIGPGAGVGAQQAVLKVLGCHVPKVLDADALTAFEKHPELLLTPSLRLTS
jgi:hypothetical protein